MKKWLELYSI